MNPHRRINDPTKTDTVGRVWKMNPSILRDDGVVPVIFSTYLAPVEGVHYFLCLIIKEGLSVWTPLFTANTGENRREIFQEFKVGDRDFRDHSTYLDIRQFWVAPKDHLSGRVSYNQRTLPNSVKSTGIHATAFTRAEQAITNYNDAQR